MGQTEVSQVFNATDADTLAFELVSRARSIAMLVPLKSGRLEASDVNVQTANLELTT